MTTTELLQNIRLELAILQDFGLFDDAEDDPILQTLKEIDEKIRDLNNRIIDGQI